MRVIGIVAEFNPFHNGHEYLIQKAREAVGDDRAIVMICMSGPFCQRGEPSILPKHTRAKQALYCGSDVVVELPFTFAMAPSNRFAQGAIDLFVKSSVVTDIAFGIEFEDSSLITKLSEINFDDIDSYKALLKENLSSGMSFPSARANAIYSICSSHEADIDISQEDLSNLPNTLRSPNSILALDYLIAIRRANLKVNVHMIPRASSEHNYSASTIRHMYFKNRESSTFISSTANSLIDTMPAKSLACMLSGLSCKEYSLLNMDAYIEDFLAYLDRNCSSQEDEASLISYMGDGLDGFLTNSLSKLNSNECTFDSISSKLQTKHFTMPRIFRAISSAILNQKTSFVKGNETVPYIRVLGFNKEGRYCLKIMSKCAKVPIISNCSDYLEYSSNPSLQAVFRQDLQANNYHAKLLGMKRNYEWELPPIHIK